MPELPEVETIKNQLRNKIRGKKIEKVEVRLAKMIKHASVNFFKSKVIGAQVKDVCRRAKLLIIKLSNGYSLVIHLKISGQIIYLVRPAGQVRPDQKHTHLIYHFSDNTCLLHNDLRQFGYVKLIKTPDLEELFVKENYGPEPLKKSFTPHLLRGKKNKRSPTSVRKGAGFTLKKFTELLKQRPKKKIKPLLMDQTFIAGVGNIYAQEVCWWAKVLPIRLVKSLSETEIKDLYYCLIKILKAAIKAKGTTVVAYINARGQKGGYASRLKVYGRENEKCQRCGKRIKKIVLAGRGTCYCSGCQK